MATNFKWSQGMVENFISLIQQYECIYSIRSADYLNRNAKAQAFNNICTQMHLEANVVNVGELKKKWRNLRSQFVREKREMRASKKSGAGLCDVYTPKLWCFAQLEFLEAHTKIREGQSNYEDFNAPQPSPSTQAEDNSAELIDGSTDDSSIIEPSEEPRRKIPQRTKVFSQLKQELASFKEKIAERKVRRFAWLGDLVSSRMEEIDAEYQDAAAWKVQCLMQELVQKSKNRTSSTSSSTSSDLLHAAMDGLFDASDFEM